MAVVRSGIGHEQFAARPTEIFSTRGAPTPCRHRPVFGLVPLLLQTPPRDGDLVLRHGGETPLCPGHLPWPSGARTAPNCCRPRPDLRVVHARSPGSAFAKDCGCADAPPGRCWRCPCDTGRLRLAHESKVRIDFRHREQPGSEDAAGIGNVKELRDVLRSAERHPKDFDQHRRGARCRPGKIRDHSRADLKARRNPERLRGNGVHRYPEFGEEVDFRRDVPGHANDRLCEVRVFALAKLL